MMHTEPEKSPCCALIVKSFLEYPVVQTSSAPIGSYCFAESRFVHVEDEDAQYCLLNSEELFTVPYTKKWKPAAAVGDGDPSHLQ
jgi:hypothetical protein